ncbi:heavy metal translocating P-type ATPase [Staphylococcus felis]|uniref:heavy metal translocating P-type ATPase n=1 Tax=Staphylococcus felis TaxID=46127 RepID=UPI003F4374E8
MTKIKEVFKIEGLSCANCANKFEKNVKKIKTVEDAVVNFGASKIYVEGHVTIDELEHAGSFENLSIKPEHHVDRSKVGTRNPSELTLVGKIKLFYHNYQKVCIATLLLALGYFSYFGLGQYHLVTLLLYLFSILLSGHQLIIQGFKNLIHFEFDMQALMTIAVIGGLLIGQWGEVAVVIILFAISEELEAYAMSKARKSMESLMEIAPQQATVIRGDQRLNVNVEEVKVNELIYIKPGQKIPLDGKIKFGSAFVNEAAVTGESMPVQKSVDEHVFAGTLNMDGLLKVQVSKISSETTIAKIIQLVEKAQVEKAPQQQFIEKFAKYYTPLIMLIALTVATMPPLFFNGSWVDWIYQGLSVLVVGCPCALVIATPISIVSSIGNAAKNGVLIKGGVHLEQLSKIRAIAFDKTGTLTLGQPEVKHFEYLGQSEDQYSHLSNIASIENESQHPVAKALYDYLTEHFNMNITAAHAIQSINGRGIRGFNEKNSYTIGHPPLFENIDSQILNRIRELENQGMTVVLAACNQDVFALFGIQDQVREQSENTISELKKLGIQNLIMLTGDNESSAKSVGDRLGLTKIKASLLPEDKLNFIQNLERNHTSVAMIGDGVNDAPALARASVGVSMGAASTDVAIETADIALMGDDISKLPYAYKLSRSTMNVVKTNIIFAIAIKVIALLLVIPGWLTLWIAIFSDMGATLIVALNAIRLLYVKSS